MGPQSYLLLTFWFYGFLIICVESLKAIIKHNEKEKYFHQMAAFKQILATFTPDSSAPAILCTLILEDAFYPWEAILDYRFLISLSSLRLVAMVEHLQKSPQCFNRMITALSVTEKKLAVLSSLGLAIDYNNCLFSEFFSFHLLPAPKIKMILTAVFGMDELGIVGQVQRLPVEEMKILLKDKSSENLPSDFIHYMTSKMIKALFDSQVDSGSLLVLFLKEFNSSSSFRFIIALIRYQYVRGYFEVASGEMETAIKRTTGKLLDEFSQSLVGLIHHREGLTKLCTDLISPSKRTSFYQDFVAMMPNDYSFVDSSFYTLLDVQLTLARFLFDACLLPISKNSSPKYHAVKSHRDFENELVDDSADFTVNGKLLWTRLSQGFVDAISQIDWDMARFTSIDEFAWTFFSCKSSENNRARKLLHKKLKESRHSQNIDSYPSFVNGRSLDTRFPMPFYSNTYAWPKVFKKIQKDVLDMSKVFRWYYFGRDSTIIFTSVIPHLTEYFDPKWNVAVYNVNFSCTNEAGERIPVSNKTLTVLERFAALLAFQAAHNLPVSLLLTIESWKEMLYVFGNNPDIVDLDWVESIYSFRAFYNLQAERYLNNLSGRSHMARNIVDDDE